MASDRLRAITEFTVHTRVLPLGVQEDQGGQAGPTMMKEG